MQLHIINPNTIDLPEAFGITPERQKDLSRRLDEMVTHWGNEPTLVRTSTIFVTIASFCDSPEELSYCILLHMGWHQNRGMQLVPRMPRAVNNSGKMEFLIGLTHADILHLQNAGVVQVNPKDAGLVDLPITVFLGGTHEHMAAGLAKHQGVAYKFVDSHGDKKN